MGLEQARTLRRLLVSRGERRRELGYLSDSSPRFRYTRTVSPLRLKDSGGPPHLRGLLSSYLVRYTLPPEGEVVTKKSDHVEKKKPGPDPTPVNPDTIEELSSRGSKWHNLADYLGLSERQLRRRRNQNPELDRAYARGKALLKLSIDTESLNLALLPIEEAAKLKGGMNAKARMLEWAGIQHAEHSRGAQVVLREPPAQEDLSSLSTEELERRRDAVRELREHAETLAEEE